MTTYLLDTNLCIFSVLSVPSVVSCSCFDPAAAAI
jgi:hypothetical protein